MKNLGTLKPAGNKLFSSPVLAQISGFRKKVGTGKTIMDISSEREHTVPFQMKRNTPGRY